jgi:hypothetical protein
MATEIEITVVVTRGTLPPGDWLVVGKIMRSQMETTMTAMIGAAKACVPARARDDVAVAAHGGVRER